ncbi:MAG TPA: polyhydroxyalkanoate synthesis regulator DNA-binding domain-containing protein [Vicinamibacteria bacterium]|nr:polyhydroxyalkanoate synthesis regulator DNA-binding domain-containing protein [Vicinamibacteria bacterium]
MSPERSAPRPRSIRRYENRKLYDPEAGRYVTLEDVGRMVAGGGEVEVVDQKTGEDLTSFTLAQVLLERVRTGASRIPRQVLTRLIRIATGPSSAWGDWPEPQDAAGRARQEAERIVSRVLGRGRLSLDEAVAVRQDVGQMVHRLVTEAQAGVESRLKSLLERGEGVAGRSLEALRGGLEAFEAYIEKPAARGRPASPARRGRPRRPGRPKKSTRET